MPPDTPPPTRRVTQWFPVFVVVAAVVVAPFAVPSGSTEAGPGDDTLRQGAEVYSSVCSSCHQPGGAGLPGSFPPLNGNPNVDDAAYVEDVIRNGLSGAITVNGETYDGVMPAQSTLGDADVAAVIAYVQSGFAAPEAPAVDVPDAGPVAGTELPALANMGWIAAVLIALGAGALVLGPRVIAAHDRREVTWLDAWMKTAVIVVGAVFVTTIVPARVLEFDTVQDLPRTGQDLIAVGLWGGGVLVVLVALWYAHRERRI